MVLFVLALTALTAQAQAYDPTQLARYIPADADVYVGLRIDDGYLETLDGVLASILNKLPDDLRAQVPPITLRQALLGSLPRGVTYEGIRQWLGDYAAFGVSNAAVSMDDDFTNDDEALTYAVVAIKDKAAFEAFLLEQTPALANITPIAADNFTIYADPEGEQTLAYNNEVFIVTNGDDIAVDGLNMNPAFTSTVDKMPADSYNIFVYINSATFGAITQANMPSGLGQNPFEALNVDLANLSPTALGFTVLDGRNLTIDVLSPNVPGIIPAFAPVDPAFARLIPAEMSYVGHTTNIAGSLSQALDFFSTASQDSENPMSVEQISNLFNGLTGLDLQDDVLSWMGGDAAFIMDTDVPNLLGSLMTGTVDELPLSFGILIETDGSDRPAAVAEALGRILSNQANSDEMTVTNEIINGVNVVMLTGEVENLDAPVQIVIGANDTLFVVATRPLAEQIFSGDYAGLDTAAAFQEATTYMLPNSGAVLYTDNVFVGDIVAGAVLALTFQGPTTGNDSTEDSFELIRFAYDLVSSTSISSTLLDDGNTLTRLVLTLAQ
jgi:hypothetical protein